MLVSSVPLSETQAAGLPRSAMIASSSRPTRRPDSEVSATSARHSRVKSSIVNQHRSATPYQIMRMILIRWGKLEHRRGPDRRRLEPLTRGTFIRNIKPLLIFLVGSHVDAETPILPAPPGRPVA